MAGAGTQELSMMPSNSRRWRSVPVALEPPCGVRIQIRMLDIATAGMAEILRTGDRPQARVDQALRHAWKFRRLGILGDTQLTALMWAPAVPFVPIPDSTTMIDFSFAHAPQQEEDRTPSRASLQTRRDAGCRRPMSGYVPVE